MLYVCTLYMNRTQAGFGIAPTTQKQDCFQSSNYFVKQFPEPAFDKNKQPSVCFYCKPNLSVIRDEWVETSKKQKIVGEPISTLTAAPTIYKCWEINFSWFFVLSFIKQRPGYILFRTATQKTNKTINRRAQ